MNHDDLDRLLGDAFDARARAAVPDSTAPPAPRFADAAAADAAATVLAASDGAAIDPAATGHGAPVLPATRRRRARWVAPLSAAAAVVAAVGIGVAVANSGHGGSSGPAASSGSTSAFRADPGAKPVHISTLNDDGATYGVAMPVVAYFTGARVTDGRGLQAATTVTVNDRPIEAAWYFEPSSAGKGPLEAHLRPQSYWPAHSAIHVSIAARGISAGKDLGYDDDLSVDFKTGAQTVVVVDSTAHKLYVNIDGKNKLTCSVALGAPASPTRRGTKVIMNKQRKVQLTGPSGTTAKQYDEPVSYAQRLTYDGEYLLAAPWDTALHRGGKPANTSSGSTLLTTADAKKLYSYTAIGDPVKYSNATGPAMQLGAGFGDWNVLWSTWLTGGAVRTH